MIPIARTICMVACFVLLVTKHEIAASVFAAVAVILSIENLLRSKKSRKKRESNE